ncbi:hypothetical protein [Bradyrhizobium sp. USDA 3315]
MPNDVAAEYPLRAGFWNVTAITIAIERLEMEDSCEINQTFSTCTDFDFSFAQFMAQPCIRTSKWFIGASACFPLVYSSVSLLQKRLQGWRASARMF